MKTTATLVALLLLAGVAYSQPLQTDVFVRQVHWLNHTFTTRQTAYVPTLSAGVTLRRKAVFCDVAAFIDQQNTVGLYTFFGSGLRSRPVGDGWLVNTLWFGEVALLPAPPEQRRPVWTYTSGMVFALVRPYSWGSLALPLTVGGAYSQGTVSLNVRTVLNCSINLR